MNSSGAAAGLGVGTPFTALQWQELEHQALIYKYMVAGKPVPPELLLPYRMSMEAMSSRYYHPTLGYCSYFGKKLDPEPGRCRRTDGKKWRCSKDAYPDSKYCERHMHRGRNRSRKPVESQNLSQSQSSSSTVTSLTPTGSSGSGSGGGSFQSLPLHPYAGGSNAPGSGVTAASSSQLHMDTGSYGIGNKDFRYFSGVKTDVDERSFFSEASGSARGIGIDSSMDSSWHLMPSRVSSLPLSKAGNGSLLQNNHPELHSLQDFGQASIGSLPRQQQQQQHSFFGQEYCSSEPVKHESQSLRPFFDEWPKARDAWSDLEDERSNRTSYSTTQLSISIAMASSDFSTTSSRSPNDD